MGHLAAAFENHAFVHTQTGGENVAPEDRRLMNFHPVLGSDASVHLPADDDGTGLDITMDARTFADDQGIGGIDLAAKSSADPDGSLKAKFPLELASVVDDPSYGRMG